MPELIIGTYVSLIVISFPRLGPRPTWLPDAGDSLQTTDRPPPIQQISRDENGFQPLSHPRFSLLCRFSSFQIQSSCDTFSRWATILVEPDLRSIEDEKFDQIYPAPDSRAFRRSLDASPRRR